MPPAPFICRDCAAEFSLPEAVLAKARAMLADARPVGMDL